jgi:predicted nucleic acid-binding protein
LRIEQRIYARNETLHTVHLLDVEFAQVLRRLVREGTVAAKRAEESIEDLAALRITRYAPILLLNRVWRLRQNLSAYDATYVALAEELRAPFITRDRRIAAAPGHAAAVEIF